MLPEPSLIEKFSAEYLVSVSRRWMLNPTMRHADNKFSEIMSALSYNGSIRFQSPLGFNTFEILSLPETTSRATVELVGAPSGN